MFHRFISCVLLLLLASTAVSANEKNPFLPDTYNFKRAIEAYSVSDNEEALNYLNKELEENPKNGYAHLIIALIKAEEEEYGMALSSLNMAQKLINKKDTDNMNIVLQTRANTYLELGDTVKALNDLNTAIKLMPENTDNYEKRAEIYYEQNKFDLSDADYNKIISLDEGGVMGHMGLGRNALERKDWDTALKHFNHVLKLHEDYGDGYYFRSCAYTEQKKWPQAIDDLIKAIEYDDMRSLVALMTLPPDAHTILINKLRLKCAQTNNVNMWHIILGNMYETDGLYPRALEYYKKAYDIEADPTLHTNIARCYGKMEQYDRAVQSIEQAILADSTDYDLFSYLAQFEYFSGDTESALARLSTCIDGDPMNLDHYNTRGRIYEDLKQFDKAIDDYSMALAIDDTDLTALLARGRSQVKKGQALLGKTDLEQMIALDTTAYATNMYKAYAYFYLGQHNEALAEIDAQIAHAETSEELDNNDIQSLYYNVACVYSLMGKTNEATKYIEKSFQHGYNGFDFIKKDTDFDNARQDPAFNSLVDKYYRQWKESLGDTSQDENTQWSTIVSEVPYTMEGGVCKVKCSINDLPLHFIFDTGASSVSISSVEANFMYKNGYLNKNDIKGNQAFSTATGEITVGTLVNLRKVQVGDVELKNVEASVTKSNSAPLLLGQSVFQKLGSVEMDNAKRVLRITYRKKVK